MKGITVLVVDDSPTFLEIIKDVLERFSLVGKVVTTDSPLDAIARLKTIEPDLVFLDLNMPGIDGLSALAKMHVRIPELDVVIVSGEAANSARLTIQAIEQGALDFVLKPVGLSFEAAEDYFLSRLSPFIRRAHNRVRANDSSPLSAPTLVKDSELPKPKGFTGEIKLVVIGAATGAPTCLPQVLAALPESLPVPVLVHIDVPQVFLRFLNRTMMTKASMTIEDATDGKRLTATKIIIAPSSQMTRVVMTDNVLSLAVSTREKDVQQLDDLLGSVADCLTSGCLSVIMTGMGPDGADGVARLRSSGRHYCIAQSPQTCTAAEMPEAVISANLVDEVVPLDGLAERISSLIS